MANGPELARAYVTILPDMTGAAREIERGLRGVDTSRVGRDMGDNVGGTMAGRIKSLIGPALALASSAAIGAFAKATVDAAKNMQQSIGAVDSVFKDSGDQIHAWAKNAAKDVGISANSYNELATLIGSQLKNGGTAIDEIGGKTNELITLGADLSSMFGGEATEAVAALSSALKGERDPIERYGVSLNQAKIDAEAAALGFEKVGSALSSEATQAATLSLIMKQTADAQGNFGRETDTLANRQQVLNAMFEDGKARLGEDLLPAATAFTSLLIAGLNPAVNAASVVIGEVTGGFTAFGAAFKAADGEVTSAGFPGIMERLGGLTAELAPGVKSAFGEIGATISTVATEIWTAIGPTIKALLPQILTLVTTMSPLAIIFQSLQPVLPQLGAAIGALAGALGGVLAAILPTIVKLVGTLVEVLSGSLADILPTIAELLTTVGLVLADTLVALLPIIVPLIGILAEAFVALMPLIGDLVEFVGGALSDILVAIMPIILEVATILGQVLGNAIDALLPIFPVLVDIAISLLGALMPLIPAVLQVVSALLPLVPVTLQLTTALLPVFLQLIELLLPVLTGLVTLLVSLLVPVVNLLAGAIEWLVGKITTAVTWFVDLAAKGGALNSALSTAWSGIKSAAETAWNWVRDNVFSPFNTAVTALGTAFTNVKDVISTAWTAIQNAATAPVNFIIETVYTNGIKKLFDTVAEKLGLDLRLPVVNKIGSAPVAGRPVNAGAFASGGVLPGYTPGKDVHEFYSPTGGRLSLSGGEAIMRPEFTRAMGGAAGIARLNAAAIKGQAFAGGGVWGWVKDKLGDAWDFTSNAASAVGNFMKDPITGALEVISKPVQALLEGIGAGDVGTILAGAPKALLSGMVNSAKSIFGEPVPQDGTGAKAPAGPAMGYQAMIAAIQAAIPGTRITSSYRPGAITAVGAKSFHGMGRAIDMAPSMALFNYLSGAYPGAAELLYSPAGARQIIGGKRTNTSGVTNANHFDHVHWAMANGGVIPKVYDDGGWLPPGGMAINTSTRPEPVFSGEQWDKVGNGMGAGGTFILEVQGQQFPVYLRSVADAAINDDKRARSGYRGRS